MMKKNNLISDIRSILITDWDPIGIADNPNLSDEYDGYISSIIKALKQHSPIDAIVAILKSIEKTEMEISQINEQRLYVIASKLKNIAKENGL